VSKWDEANTKARHVASSAAVTARQAAGGVLGPKRLVRQIDYPQNRTVITISVTGEKSCQATIGHVLKPGYREFTFPRVGNRQIAFFTQPRAAGSTRQID
jgi:uncharacterized protein (DUF2147 family)